ncbi:MAG TPA: SIMPL domain-containing protein [Allosphingosinicella sp.]
MRTLVPLLLLSAAACSQAPDPRGVGRGETLLQVSATGRAEARPDEARFTAGVSTIGATAAAASSANNETINRVAKALESLGVNKDDLQTRSVTLGRIDYGKDRGRFRAENTIEVRMRDVSKAGQAIAATTDAGANVLSGPDLRVTDGERTKNAAFAAAYRAARSRAEAVAKASGMKIARVLTIRDDSTGDPSPYFGAEEMADATMARNVAAPPPVHAGLDTSMMRIRVDFALAED